ncbi:MAG TPA: DoxX family protein [Actinomycetota bacterium]|nr:DoxX family protein [Actinomycetota bacterium]
MSDAAGILLLIGRVLFSVFFLFSGLGFHIAKSGMAEQYARSMGFPLASLAGWPTGAWMVAGALSVALGIWPDIGLLMLIAFALPAALFFHRFWKMEGEMAQTQQQLFFRNVIIVGGALALFALFASAGDALRYVITAPVFRF